jgi:oxygen-independent coproporphyrinogen-3 oxidase
LRFDPIYFAAYFSNELQQLEALATDGLLNMVHEGICVSAKGRLLLRSIAMVFDRYLNSAADNGRYSKAI